MCVLPFIHYSIKPNNAIKPCCRFMTHLDEHYEDFKPLKVENLTPHESLNNSPFDEVRRKMLNGEKIAGCGKCYMEEAAMGASMRDVMNSRYGVEQYIDGHTELRYLEVAFGNYCNLGCRTCNSTLSTSWHSDDSALQEHYPERTPTKQILNVPFNWSPSDFDKMEEIKFTGGEPMLHPNFIKFLDVILEGGNETHITLDIFTNTSWVPKAKILNRLNKFKSVKIWLSIDGVGSIQDYVRHNSKWEVVKQSAEAWCVMEKLNPSVYSIILTPTLNMYNVLEFEDTIDWWIELRKTIGLPLNTFHESGDVVLSIVTNPSYLNISNFPNKKMIIDKLNLYLKKFVIDTPEYRLAHKISMTIIKLLETNIPETNELEKFIKYTKDLDKLRNQSLKDMNPKLYEIIKLEVPDYDIIKGKMNDQS